MLKVQVACTFNLYKGRENMGRHIIKSVKIRGVLGDKWILRLEKKAFGWHYWSEETEENPYLETTSSGGFKTGKNLVDWLEFRRKSPYSKNILFCLTEFLSNIWSVIRRLVTLIAIPAFIIILVLSLVMQFGCNDVNLATTGYQILKYLAIIYGAGILAPSFIFMGLGVLWRAIFRIDDKCRAQLRADGYNDDLSACDFADE